MFLHIEEFLNSPWYSNMDTGKECWLCSAGGTIHSAEQRNALIASGGYASADFIPIPQFDVHMPDIAREYLAVNRVHRIRMKRVAEMDDMEIRQAVHRYSEENDQVGEWLAFCSNRLIGHVIRWCEEQGISYTLKPHHGGSL